jgi:copper chaperone CopZ
MKDQFREYYRPSKEEFEKLWEECLFVLDTNILLNFYRYSDKTNKDFFSILEKISDRLWIPYHVAYEYQKNRLSVISEKMEAYKELDKIMDNQSLIFKNAFKTAIQGKGFERHPVIEIKDINNKIDNCFSDIKKQIKENEGKHPDLIKNDSIRERISILLKDKIGQKFSDDKLQDIYKKGDERFGENIPPGFVDQNKKGYQRFGDLIIWFEIIEKANLVKKPIIFVVDDGKEDWWNIVRGKTTGPRPELLKEFYTEVNLQFYMYKSERFTSCAEKQLDLKFDSNTVKEIREVSQEKRDVTPQTDVSLVGPTPTKNSQELLSTLFHMNLYDKVQDSDYTYLINKRKEIKRSIIDNQVKLLQLQDKYERQKLTPGTIFGFYPLQIEISNLQGKIRELKSILVEIDDAIKNYYFI